MRINEILKKYTKVEIEILLAHVLNKPKEFLYMEPAYKLSASKLISLRKLIKRREKGEPIAYILGYKEFLGLRFKVNKNVLVPRPETELLVESIKLKVESMGQNNPVRILDVGTGSGAIAVSLANQVQGARLKVQISASDVSQNALAVAKENAKLHKVKIKFIKSSLLQNIKEDFDIIVANLPYGWKAWKNNSSIATKGLKFEPQVALFTEENGLKLIRELLEQIPKETIKPKLVYLEFDPRQKQDLAKLIKRTLPSSKATFYKDYAKMWRFVEITLE